MQPNIPQTPYVRYPSYRMRVPSIIDISLDKLMEHRMREAQYNAQQQAVASRTPTVLTDPLLNLRVRDYYRAKYERSIGAEVAGRISGGLEGAALGAGIASTIMSTILLIGTILSPIPGDEAIAATAVGGALSGVGKALGAATTAGALVRGSAAVGAGIGALTGTITSNYSTWYATRDMFRNLWQRQSVGRGVLNSLSFVGNSMDLMGSSAVIKSSIYALLTSQNALDVIKQTYGLTKQGRTDMDFSMIREELGFDLGGVGNFVFDMTGETLTDIGNFSGIAKGVTNGFFTFGGAVDKQMVSIVIDNAKQLFSKTDNVVNNKTLLKTVVKYIKEDKTDDLILLLQNQTNLNDDLAKLIGDSAIRTADQTKNLREYITKFMDSIKKSASKKMAYRLNQVFEATDFMDDFLTHIMWRVGNPGIAVISGAKDINKFLKKHVTTDKFLEITKAIFGNSAIGNTIENIAKKKVYKEIMKGVCSPFIRDMLSDPDGSKTFDQILNIVNKEDIDIDGEIVTKVNKQFKQFCIKNNIKSIKDLYDLKDTNLKAKILWEKINNYFTEQVSEKEKQLQELYEKRNKKLAEKIISLKKKDNTAIESINKELDELDNDISKILNDKDYTYAIYVNKLLSNPESYCNAQKALSTIYQLKNKAKYFGKLNADDQKLMNDTWFDLVRNYLDTGNSTTIDILQQMLDDTNLVKLINDGIDNDVLSELKVLQNEEVEKLNKAIGKLSEEYYEKLYNNLLNELKELAKNDPELLEKINEKNLNELYNNIIKQQNIQFKKLLKKAKQARLNFDEKELYKIKTEIKKFLYNNSNVHKKQYDELIKIIQGTTYSNIEIKDDAIKQMEDLLKEYNKKASEFEIISQITQGDSVYKTITYKPFETNLSRQKRIAEEIDNVIKALDEITNLVNNNQLKRDDIVNIFSNLRELSDMNIKEFTATINNILETLYSVNVFTAKNSRLINNLLAEFITKRLTGSSADELLDLSSEIIKNIDNISIQVEKAFNDGYISEERYKQLINLLDAINDTIDVEEKDKLIYEFFNEQFEELEIGFKDILTNSYNISDDFIYKQSIKLNDNKVKLLKRINQISDNKLKEIFIKYLNGENISGDEFNLITNSGDKKLLDSIKNYQTSLQTQIHLASIQEFIYKGNGIFQSINEFINTNSGYSIDELVNRVAFDFNPNNLTVDVASDYEEGVSGAMYRGKDIPSKGFRTGHSNTNFFYQMKRLEQMLHLAARTNENFYDIRYKEFRKLMETFEKSKFINNSEALKNYISALNTFRTNLLNDIKLVDINKDLNLKIDFSEMGKPKIFGYKFDTLNPDLGKKLNNTLNNILKELYDNNFEKNDLKELHKQGIIEHFKLLIDSFSKEERKLIKNNKEFSDVYELLFSNKSSEAAAKDIIKPMLEDEIDDIFKDIYIKRNLPISSYIYKKPGKIIGDIKKAGRSFVIFDTETTGQTSNGLYQISAVRYTVNNKGKFVENGRINLILNPKYADDNKWIIDDGVDNLYAHLNGGVIKGSTRKVWEDLYNNSNYIKYNSDVELAKAFYKFLQDDDIMVAHNARFDFQQLINTIGIEEAKFKCDVIDSARIQSYIHVFGDSDFNTNLDNALRNKNVAVVRKFIINGEEHYYLDGVEVTIDDLKQIKKRHTIMITKDLDNSTIEETFDGGPLHIANNDINLMSSWFLNDLETMSKNDITLDDLEDSHNIIKRAKGHILDKFIKQNNLQNLKDIIDTSFNKINTNIIQDKDGRYWFDGVEFLDTDETFMNMFKQNLINSFDTIFDSSADFDDRYLALINLQKQMEDLENLDNDQQRILKTLIDNLQKETKEFHKEIYGNLYMFSTNSLSNYFEYLVNDVDEAFEDINILKNLRDPSAQIYFQMNTAYVAALNNMTFNTDSKLDDLLYMLTGNLDAISSNEFKELGAALKFIMEKNPDAYPEIKEAVELITRLKNNSKYYMHLLDKMDTRMYDVFDNIIKKISYSRNNGVLKDSEEYFNLFNDLKEYVTNRSKFQNFDLYEAELLLYELMDKYDDLDMPNAKNINKLKQLLNISIVSVTNKIIEESGDQNKFLLSKHINEQLNELFEQLRSRLSVTDAQNKLLKLDRYNLKEFEEISTFTEDDVSKLLPENFFDYFNSEMQFDEGVYRLRPSVAIANRARITPVFPKDYKNDQYLRKEMYSVLGDIFKENDQYTALPFTDLRGNRLYNVLEQAAIAFGMDPKSFIHNCYRNNNYGGFDKNKQMLLDLFDHIQNEIANDPVDFANYFNLDPNTFNIRYLNFISALNGINENTFSYLKNPDDVIEKIKCMIAFNLISNNSIYKKYSFDQSDYKILSPVINQIKKFDNRQTFDTSTKLFDSVRSLYTTINPDGTFNYDVEGFKNYLNKHPEYYLTYMNNKGVITRLNTYNDNLLKQILMDDQGLYSIISKDSFIGITNKLQPIVIKNPFFRFLHNELLRPLKILSLANLNFILQNTITAVFQNTISTGSKINVVKTVSRMIQAHKDINKHGDLLTRIISSDTTHQFIGGNSNQLNLWLDLLDNSEYIEALRKNGETELADILDNLTKEDIDLIKEIDMYIHATSAYGEINELTEDVFKRNELLKQSNKAKEKLNNLNYTDSQGNNVIDIISNTNKAYNQEEIDNIIKAKNPNIDDITLTNKREEFLDLQESIKSNKYQNMSTEELTKEHDALLKKQEIFKQHGADLSYREYRRLRVIEDQLRSRNLGIADRLVKIELLKRYLNLNEQLETTFRVAAIRGYLEDGMSFDEATNEVIKRHFIYNNKSIVEQYAEFFIPFISYPLRMIPLVESMTHDALTMDLLYRYNKYSWGDEDASRSDYLSKRKARGDIPVGNKLLQLTSPFNEGVMSIQNPIYTINNKLNPLLKPIVDSISGAEHNRWNQIPVISNVNNLTQAITEGNILHSITSDYYRYSSFGNYYMPRINNRIGGTLYNRMYTSTGRSRILMSMQPLNTSNLKYRVNDIMKYSGPRR